MVDVQTIFIVVAVASVFIAAINSIISSRRAAQNDQIMLETRQAQLFTQIYDWWRSRDGVKAYANYRYKYNKLVQEMGLKHFVTHIPWLGMKETLKSMPTREHYCISLKLGVLVKKGLIDIELVEDLLSQRIIWLWENMIGPSMDCIRKITDDPKQYDSIEYLYHEMEQRQHATVS